MSGSAPPDSLIEVSSNISDDFFWYKEVYDADVVDVNSPLVRRVVIVADALSSHPDIADESSFSVKSDKRVEDGKVIVEVKCEPTSDSFDGIVSIGTVAALMLSRVTVVGSPMAILSVAVSKDFAPNSDFFSAIEEQQKGEEEDDSKDVLGDVEG